MIDCKSIRKVNAKKGRFQPKANVDKQTKKSRCKLVVNYLKLNIKKVVLATGGAGL